VQSGTLAFLTGEGGGYSNDGVNSGIYQISQGATLAVGSQTMDANSTVRGAGTMEFRANGNTIAGNYNITGRTNAHGGDLSFLPGATVTSVGQTLDIGFQAAVSFDTGKAIPLNDVVVNGYLGGSDTLTVSGTVSGAGTITANHVIVPGNISPGNSPGILNVQGNLAMKPSTSLTMELGGNSNANQTEYDVVTSTGGLTIDGSLSLHVINGYVPTSADHLAIVSSTSPLVGTFENVTAGARLLTFDGKGSFEVDYGSASPFGSNNVVLSNFQVVPEPASGLLLMLAAPTLLHRRRRGCY
jgi:hypothetical protein